MSQRSISGSPQLAKSIRSRRQELNLTIEEAAAKAGVGTKTWSRYEAGESIRSDKYKGVCKALKWHSFPDQDREENTIFNLEEYKNHEAWSQEIADNYGQLAAISFVIGSDILLDSIQEDMNELSSMPAGTHIGQLDLSVLEPYMPSQFLTRYDYEFLYHLRAEVSRLRKIAHAGNIIRAHSVLEELIFYLIVDEARFLIESIAEDIENAGIEYDDHWDEWIFDLFGDCDLETLLYSGYFLTQDNIYHFDHWDEQQLWQ